MAPINASTMHFGDNISSWHNLSYVLLFNAVVMILIGGIGNSATILAFALDPKVRSKPSDFIVLNLACSDLGVIAFAVPMTFVPNFLGHWPLLEIGCRMYFFIHAVLVLVSVQTIVLLSWDRYRLLTLDYTKYIKKHDRKYIFKCLRSLWLLSTLPGILGNVIWNVGNKPSTYIATCIPPFTKGLYWNIFILFLALFPTVLVTVFGVLIVFQLKKRFKMWQKVQPAKSAIPLQESDQANTTCNNETGGSTALSTNNSSYVLEKKCSLLTFKKRYIKPIMTYFAIVITLIICSTPFVVYSFNVCMRVNCDSGFHVYGTKLVFQSMYMSSCLNPILYGCTNSRIRQFHKRHLALVARTLQRE